MSPGSRVIGRVEANRNAPDFSEGRIEIAAPPEAVWDLMAETTIASMEESFDGLTARLFCRRLQKQLDATTESGLKNLKATVEQRQPG